MDSSDHMLYFPAQAFPPLTCSVCVCVWRFNLVEACLAITYIILYSSITTNIKTWTVGRAKGSKRCKPWVWASSLTESFTKSRPKHLLFSDQILHMLWCSWYQTSSTRSHCVSSFFQTFWEHYGKDQIVLFSIFVSIIDASEFKLALPCGSTASKQEVGSFLLPSALPVLPSYNTFFVKNHGVDRIANALWIIAVIHPW